MRALWVKRFAMETGQILEAEIVRERDTPYVKFSAVLYDLHALTEPKPLPTTKSLTDSLESVVAEVSRRGKVLKVVDINPITFAPEAMLPWIHAATSSLQRWHRIEPAFNTLDIEAPWIEIAEYFADTRGLPACTKEVASLFRQIASRILDVTIWEFRRLRLQREQKARIIVYTYSLRRISECLEQLGRLEKNYKPAHLRMATVIDFAAAKERLRGSLCL